MKKLFYLVVLLLSVASCKDKVIHHYKMYEPVYMSQDDFKTAVKFEAPRSISTRGNILVKDHYLFIIETNKGIHFYDNSNPENPVNLGFLVVPACTNAAIKGNMMYAQSLTDLVCISLENMTNPAEVRRLENSFPTAEAGKLKHYPCKSVDSNLGLVVDWNVIDVEEEGDMDDIYGGPIMTMEGPVVFNTTSGGTAGVSTAGSMAKFALSGNYLYVLDQNTLTPINIENASNPLVETSIVVGGGPETLFPKDNFLFMGTQTGMMIYSLQNPSIPSYVSIVSHMRSCDPVVVQGNYAYVTVRSNSWCGGNINQLQVIDITNVYAPNTIQTFEMKQPHGLGVDGNTLFICDGEAGLKVFDATNPANCGDKLLEKYKSIEAIDVIPINNVAIVIGEDELTQYDYSNPKNIKKLSSIPFEK